MLTALTVINKTDKIWFKRFVNYIKGNKIKTTVNQVRGVTLRHIEYTNRTGRIDWEEIDRYVGIQRNHLLCSEYLELPKNMGYKRFYSDEFAQRLCTNMALYVLSKVKNPEKIKVCIYDTTGESADVLIHLLKYCSDVKTVTDNKELYFQQAEAIIQETGISPVISNTTESMEECDLIIAPCVIKERLPLKNKAIILTSCCPQKEQNGTVYFRYHFKMPNKFDAIKPSELSDFYFASALYTKARQYQFGSIVPMLCSNYAGGARIESLCAYFGGCA